MKEYKYKINGTDYKVGVGDIDHGIVTVEVNGTPYQVEIEHKSPAPVKVVNRSEEHTSELQSQR